MTTNELIELDPQILRELLKEKEISRQEFAQQLGISTKTIQRWVNGTVRRVRPDTLGRVAQVLGVPPDRIRKSSIPLELRPINRVLEEICSDAFMARIRAMDDFPTYLKLLKTFNAQELCSAQRLTLYLQLGSTTFFLGRIRASRLYLDEALKIAYSLNDTVKIIAILSWSALREDFAGNSPEAMRMIEQAEQHLQYAKDSVTARADILFRKGHVLYHNERIEEAIPYIRDSILLEYKHPTLNLFRLGMKYYHLSECYIRQRNFSKARATLKKTFHIAEKSGWVRGQSYSHFGLGIITIFENGDCETVRGNFAKARVLRNHTTPERINTKAEQREFIYLAIKGQLREARDLVANHVRLNRRYIHFFAYSVLDALFFAKFSPETFSLRGSLIERATQYFEKNKLENALNAVKVLKSKERITKNELLELYVF
ncbi:helix-turn-helix transcriptional regulator [Bdellovibrio sp. NC01]|uniref:helix-turn-helix domain-containing protein n=1 Tax=Bdellovibrio sp. NC01 TaxID=2220073 RepID=UPI00115B88EA|nr:helix-turn-helix transcriptional regulator [Bdellovibrio sp. NC01]QDK37111.1 hypothetical protein DOE51_05650 [Bdellovibrio sp. NC01]